MLAIAVTGGMLLFYHLFADRIHIFRNFELKSMDLRFKIRGKRLPTDDIVIVVVDDTAMEYFGTWPFPRSVHAKLIDLLRADGAKAVGFDMIFSDSQENMGLSVLKQLRQYYLALLVSGDMPHDTEFGDILDQAIQFTDYDAMLAEAIKKSNNIVIPIVFQNIHPRDNDSPDSDESLPELSDSADYDNVSPEIKAAAFRQVFHPEGVEAFHTPVARKLLIPLKKFYVNARYLGSPNFFLDIDGTLRWANMAVTYNGQYYQPFSLQLFKLFKDLDDYDTKLIHGAGIQAGKTFIPLDKKGRLLINYYGPAYTFKYYSYAQVTEKTLPEGTFKDKIVLLGYAATGFIDAFTTPFSSAMPGVEKHATVISNILQEDFLIRNEWVSLIDLAYILIIGLTIGWVLPGFSALKSAAFAIAVLTIVLISNYLLFCYLNIWVNVVYPVLTLFLVSASMILFKFFTEERNKIFLKHTFKSYLSSELIEDMYEKRIMPELGGEARRLTAFFTDIENFSAIAEKLTAEQLVELLNEYLSAMTDILRREKGTLDKYEGDAIIAFFGAPADVPEHALRACRVATAMQKKLVWLCRKWRDEKQAPDEPERNSRNLSPEEWIPGARWPGIVSQMKMRIGISTGEIVVGNMGSAARMNYTMIGDTVNIASRLEQACKHYGVNTLASEQTLISEFTDRNGEIKKVMDRVEARFIDNVIVVGRTEPVRIYEIRAMKNGTVNLEKKLLSVFEEGIRYYLNMEWDKAISQFNESHRIEKALGDKSGPSQVYIQRCKTFKKNPPADSGEEWDGVFRLIRK